MNKVFVFIIGALIFGSAFATGENIPTSKSYVDTEIATKQNKIAANDGATQVLTNTGTAGEYGTKNIYDATGEYGAQTDALVDAVTMNTAVQNAIDSEFQCVEYNPNDPNDCWLMDVRGETETRSPNLFDASQILGASGWTENNGVYSGQINSLYRLGNMNACTPGPCKSDTQYTLSFTITIDQNATPNGTVDPGFFIYYTDGTSTKTPYADRPHNPGDISHIIMISEAGKTVKYIRGTYNYNALVHISDIQLQEGPTATPYVPYGNIYLPSETQ